ncbi:MAG: pyruvate dehydrogenase complex dihydrolipoamide acetyltransferase [Alphaproteobacteria bacterium]|nr:pyruvate dehydrogenase complex dihydrolipoamide acetyltransferase [Alphaproteobacteria bacterium]
MPIKVTMPALSPTMTEGNLAKWLKAEGDSVESGDVIAEIETDKATMEVEAVDEGILGKIIVPAGTPNVPVNDVIAILLEDGEEFDESMLGSNTAPPAKAATPQQEPATKAESKAPATPVSTPAPAQTAGNRIFASPLARRIAANKNIDLAQVKGSGPRGRIVKADVEGFKAGASPAASSTAAAAPLSADEKLNEYGMVYTEVPNNNIKKITAKRLQESKQTVPHFYLTIECQLDNLLAARKAINEQSGDDFKLSVNDFIVKAAAMALKAYPAANTSWTDEAVRQYKHADISVAVATPNGLMTPIVKMAENKGLKEISSQVRDLAKRARDGKLKPEEFQGGSFTVSNLGMFGIKEFGAIINPPQACILAIGGGEQKPVVEKGEIKIRTVMNCTLSVDHRAVDGAVGAEYLQIFKRYIENPVSMLI